MILRIFKQSAFYLLLALSAYVFFSPGGDGVLPFAYADKVLHFVIFVGLAITGCWQNRRADYPVAWLLTYAVTIEVVQHFFIFGRKFDLMDMAADALGLAAVITWKRRV